MFMNFSQIFQIRGLRELNIATAEPIFDQNRYDIQTLRCILHNKDAF